MLFNLDSVTEDILLSFAEGQHLTITREEEAKVSTHQIRCGQGPVVKTGSKISDHIHDLIVRDGCIHLLKENKDRQNDRVRCQIIYMENLSSQCPEHVIRIQ